MELIFCGSRNQRFAEIAIDSGFLLGAQLPGHVYYGIHFGDQDWKKPDRPRYMAALAEYRPHMATVLDWEHEEQLGEVLSWAEEAAQFVEEVILIPKVQGGVSRLPHTIGSRPVRLGYSVPTAFGGTSLGLWEFAGWPVHLLGGSPQAQMKLVKYLHVVSADGNMHQKAAQKFCTVWEDGVWKPGTIGREEDGIYRAFEISCRNIASAWKHLH